MTDLTTIPVKNQNSTNLTVSQISDSDFNKLRQAIIELQQVAFPTVLAQSTVTAGTTTQNSIEWNWIAVANATQYTLMDGSTILYQGPLLTYTQTGLTPGTSYNVTLLASATGYTTSTSYGSDTTSAIPQLATPSPTGSNYTTTGFRIDISAITNATNYIYKVNGTQVYSGSALFFDVSGLTPNTTYAIQVIAQASGYTDSNPGTTNLSTQATTPLATPSVSTTAVTTDSFELVIAAAISGAADYEYSVNGSVVHTGPELNFTVTGATQSTTYSWEVRALPSNTTINAPSSATGTQATADVLIEYYFATGDEYTALQTADTLTYSGSIVQPLGNADWVFPWTGAPANCYPVVRVLSSSFTLKNRYTDTGNPTFGTDTFDGDSSTARKFSIRGYDYYTWYAPANFTTTSGSTVNFSIS